MEVLYVPHKYQGFYKQWKENELPYRVLLSRTESELQTLKKRLSELDGILNKGRLSFSERWLPEEKKATEYAINYLQAIIDEVKDSVSVPISLPPQAPETDEKKMGYSYEQSLFNL